MAEPRICQAASAGRAFFSALDGGPLSNVGPWSTDHRRPPWNYGNAGAIAGFMSRFNATANDIPVLFRALRCPRARFAPTS